MGKITLESPGGYSVTPRASQEAGRCAESVRRQDDLTLLALRGWRTRPESGVQVASRGGKARKRILS